MEVHNTEKHAGENFNYTKLELLHRTTNEPADKLDFNDRMLANVIAFSVIFVLGSVLNVAVLLGSWQRNCSPENNISHNNMHLMVAHLAISDLIVCAVIVPLEIGWRITVEWVAGNMACKALMYLRAFAGYLSSLTLVMLSMDRYLAIAQPLASLSNGRHNRGKLMLVLAWILAALLAIPQTFVFRVIKHPRIESFHQCTTIGYFKEIYFFGLNPDLLEKIYNSMFLLAMYYIPLLVIIVTYANIQKLIWQKECGEVNDTSLGQESGNSVELRRNISLKQKSNTRALRMCILHVLAFLCCWTPYVVTTMWYIIDFPSLMTTVSDIVQDAFFLLAIFNSCVNPLVYGGFHFKSLCSKPRAWQAETLEGNTTMNVSPNIFMQPDRGSQSRNHVRFRQEIINLTDLNAEVPKHLC